MDHLNLLFRIDRLDWVFRDSSSIENLLGDLVVMLASHFRADVCSIFIYDDTKDELVLGSNTGLAPQITGKMKLKPGEGIAGTVFKKNEPVFSAADLNAANFSDNNKNTWEEHYNSFLSVPVSSGVNPVGVIILQREENNYFKARDLKALRIVAFQLAAFFENIRIITSLQGEMPREITHEKKEHLASVFLKGKAASRGYAYAKAALAIDEERFHEIAGQNYEEKYGLSALRKALVKTEKELELLQKAVEANLSDTASMIFDAHLLILKDNGFISSMTNPVQKGKNAPDAVIAAARKYITLFSASSDPYMREKVHDIEDLVTRLIRNLAGKEAKLPPVRGRIAVVADLYPSDLLKLSSEGVRGIVLLSGGATSHVSILARSLQIPMVIVNDPAAENISDDDRILIDAEIGNIFINPSKDIVKEFKDRISEQTAVKAPAMKKVTETKDGVRIKLMANINLLKDMELLGQLSCDGVGLYRSEFPFIIRKDFPSEEEQFFVYRKLVEGVPGKDVTFRTLDIGGDKMPAYWSPANKENSFLGMRSIRFSLKHRDIFVQQIRAILRAGEGSDLKIMFPMIFSLEEFNEAKEVVMDCVADLEKSGAAFNRHPKIGMMVEVPAVIEIIDEFASVVDFFSIGTNDLVQYMLAVDRTNEEVAEYYIPHHPAVLRAIKRVANAAKNAGKDLSVCGDMANKAGYLQFLLGCGIRNLSMNPIYLSENQKIISEIDLKQAEELTLRLLATGTMNIIEEGLLGPLKMPRDGKA